MSFEDMEVFIGTSMGYIIGYKLVQEKENLSLVKSFKARYYQLQASIRCIARAGIYLASGRGDETMRIHCLNAGMGGYVCSHHDGPVNCMQFVPNSPDSYMLSGCEEGTITLNDVAHGRVIKQWKAAHEGFAVTSLSVHPSGEIALSVGGDGQIRTWNLIKLKQVHGTHPSIDAYVQVKWSSSGDMYAVLLLRRFDVYKKEPAGFLYSFHSKIELTTILFMNDDILCVGDEEGSLWVHSVQRLCLLKKIKAHEDRIVDMDIMNPWVVSASRNGIIKLWSLKNEDHFNEVCSVNAHYTITCIVVVCGRNTYSTGASKRKDLAGRAQEL